MDDHVIRLRGGWECLPIDGPGGTSTRLTLPARSDSLPGGRLRLTRRFRRPPRVPDATATLRLARCPGIRSVVFNGRPIGLNSPAPEDFEVEVGPLEPRNELTIDAEPPRGEAEWGLVSLLLAE